MRWSTDGDPFGPDGGRTGAAPGVFVSPVSLRYAVDYRTVADQAVFDGVLTALLECDTPSELLARAAEARRRTSAGNGSTDC